MNTIATECTRFEEQIQMLLTAGEVERRRCKLSRLMVLIETDMESWEGIDEFDGTYARCKLNHYAAQLEQPH